MKRSTFSWEAFLWAYSTVSARKNNVLVSGKNGPVPALGLIPVFDLINHEPTLKPSSEFDYEKGVMNLMAPRQLNSGDQVYLPF